MRNVVIIIIVLAVVIIGSYFFLPQGQKLNNQAGDYKHIAYLIDGQAFTLGQTVGKTNTQYFGNEAEGDLNGDGLIDRAFIITQTTGGSGTFYYAVGAIKNSAGGYLGTAGVFLGDRIAPQTTEIKDGIVIVNYADRAPSESFVTSPSIGKSIRFKFD